MGLGNALLPTPGKILFIVLLSPLILLMLLIIFGSVLAATTLSVTLSVIISIVIGYVLVSIIYAIFTASVKILIAVLVVGLLLSAFGVTVDPVKLKLNNAFNYFDEVENQCETSSDCRVKVLDCTPCSTNRGAVHLDYGPGCFFDYDEVVLCEPLPELNVTCVNSLCQINEP